MAKSDANKWDLLALAVCIAVYLYVRSSKIFGEPLIPSLSIGVIYLYFSIGGIKGIKL